VPTFKSYFDENNRTESYYAQDFTTLDFDLQFETAVGDRNNLTLGTGFRHVDGEFERTFQVWIPDQSSELYSAFLQDEINLLRDRLWLTVGSKFEHNDFTGDEWQPSARMLWKPGVDHSVWAASAAPSARRRWIERTGSVLVAAFPTSSGTGTASLVSNPEFDSEVLIAYETGYRW